MARPTDWWEELYRTSQVSDLPWYTSDLDPDVDAALEAHGPPRGRILDLGTGPGTHAVRLAERGYDVVGTDISPSAVRKAKGRARRAKAAVTFRVDNILASSLEDESFDAVVDRGTFHVLPPDARPRYVERVRRILRPGGLLLLKTFSDKEPGHEGPHRLSRAELRRAFVGTFDVVSISESVFQGTLPRPPRALFAIFRRRPAAARGQS